MTVEALIRATFAAGDLRGGVWLACACAAAVLPRVSLGGRRPAEAVRLAHAWACGEAVTAAELRAAAEAAAAAASAVWAARAKTAAASAAWAARAARAAAEAEADAPAAWAASWPGEAAARAAWAASGASGAAEAAEAAERLPLGHPAWQALERAP